MHIQLHIHCEHFAPYSSNIFSRHGYSFPVLFSSKLELWSINLTLGVFKENVFSLIDFMILIPYVLSCSCFLPIKKNFFNVYFWERESENESGGQRQKIQSRLCAVSAKPDVGFESPWTVRSWPELKSDGQPVEPPRHPVSFIL